MVHRRPIVSTQKSVLGQIPSSWCTRSGREIAHLVTKGESPGWQGYEYADDGVLFVTSENVRDGYLDISKPKYVSEEFHAKLRRSRLKDGDILINLVGASIARSCIYQGGPQEANVNQAVCVMRLKSEVNPYWIATYLQHPRVIYHLMSQQVDSARANISLTDVRAFQFVLPPPEEQAAMIGVLGTWDRAIEQVSKLIDAKTRLKKGLMQQLLNGKQRFPDYENDPWLVCKLEEVGDIHAGGTPDTKDPSYWNGSHCWVTPTEVTKLDSRFITDTERHITDQGLRNSSAHLLPSGSVIVCTRATVGDCAINTVPMCTNQGFKSIIPRGHSADYVYYAIEAARRQFVRYAAGSTFLEVSKSDFRRVRIPLPITSEQEKIAHCLSSADTEVESLEATRERLKLQKRGLMQVLLTGKVRVNEVKEGANE